MKLVYTNENRFLVSNAKNILEATGFNVVLKNEFALGALGEVPPMDIWMELWVVNDKDYENAKRTLEEALSNKTGEDWLCQNCKEINPSSFSSCWNCQHPHG